MGDPKKPRKKYERPYKPFSRVVIEESNRLAGEYGLRNKRELWRAAYLARKYRRIARKLLSAPPEEAMKVVGPVIRRLQRYGIVGRDATLDSLLDIKVEDFLERRLQTIVWRKGLAKTPYMARQLIVHGHILVNGTRIRQPGYLVPKDEEDKIECTLKLPVQEEVQEEEGGEVNVEAREG